VEDTARFPYTPQSHGQAAGVDGLEQCITKKCRIGCWSFSTRRPPAASLTVLLAAFGVVSPESADFGSSAMPLQPLSDVISCFLPPVSSALGARLRCSVTSKRLCLSAIKRGARICTYISTSSSFRSLEKRLDASDFYLLLEGLVGTALFLLLRIGGVSLSSFQAI
jgi:hypothetical protein